MGAAVAEALLSHHDLVLDAPVRAPEDGPGGGQPRVARALGGPGSDRGRRRSVTNRGARRQLVNALSRAR